MLTRVESNVMSWARTLGQERLASIESWNTTMTLRRAQPNHPSELYFFDPGELQNIMQSTLHNIDPEELQTALRDVINGPDLISYGSRQYHADFEAQDSSSDIDLSVDLNDDMPTRNNQNLAIIPYSNNPFQFFQQSRSSQAVNNVTPSLENSSDEEENSNEYTPFIAELD